MSMYDCVRERERGRESETVVPLGEVTQWNAAACEEEFESGEYLSNSRP